MNDTRFLKRLSVDLVLMLVVLVIVIGVQSTLRIPFVYTACACSLVLLAYSLVSARNRGTWREYVFFVFWVVLLALYDPLQSAGIVGAYIGVRLLCELVSLFISNVDKILGVLVEYCFGSVLLLTAFVLMLDIRWWVLSLVVVVLLCVQWFAYRRYDLFPSELR